MCKIICQFSYVRAQHTVQGKHCSSTFHISSSTKWKVLTLYRSKSFFTRFFFPNLCLWPTTYLFSYHGLSRDPRSIRARLRFQPWVSGVYIYIYIFILVLRFEFYRFQYSRENKCIWDVEDGVFKSIRDSLLLLWQIVTCLFLNFYFYESWN